MNKLKELRHKSKMTLRELSAVTGIQNSFLSELEHGKRKMNANHAKILAPIFGVTEAYIMGDDAIKLPISIPDFLMDAMDSIFDETIEQSVKGQLDENTRLTLAIIDTVLHYEFTNDSLKKVLALAEKLQGEWKQCE